MPLEFVSLGYSNGGFKLSSGAHDFRTSANFGKHTLKPIAVGMKSGCKILWLASFDWSPGADVYSVTGYRRTSWICERTSHTEVHRNDSSYRCAPVWLSTLAAQSFNYLHHKHGPSLASIALGTETCFCVSVADHKASDRYRVFLQQLSPQLDPCAGACYQTK